MFFFFSSFDFPPDVQGLKARLACVTVTARRELLRDGNARRRFCIKPFKETILGVALPFLTRKETISNFDYKNRVNKTD